MNPSADQYTDSLSRLHDATSLPSTGADFVYLIVAACALIAAGLLAYGYLSKSEAG